MSVPFSPVPTSQRGKQFNTPAVVGFFFLPFVALRLVNRADRSRYENPDLSLMTDAELALFTHIDGEHRKLSTRAG